MVEGRCMCMKKNSNLKSGNRKKVRKGMNPLIRRIPKELIGDWKKYLVVALLLIFAIGFVSGMYIANDSMMQNLSDGYVTYKVEDGHFELTEQASEDVIKGIESGETYEPIDDDFTAVPVTVYENFFKNNDEDHDGDGSIDGTVRVYIKTEDINLASVLEGRLPETENEIAIDRMHADNVGVEVGDSILVDGQEYEICGLIAYVNYTTLHENNTDFMFDAINFDVAMVTEEGFARLSTDTHYNYAWEYEASPADEIEEKSMSDDLMKVVLTQTVVSGNSIEDYVPFYSNSAIQFAPDDMVSDKGMGGVILNVLIVIIAFIFAITISNTIEKEASAIGTMRAMGYTKRELLLHYISMPLIVTLVAAVIGNILGYTVFTNVVTGMYYNSYSLPEYVQYWNNEAFINTTVIPVVLMLVVNFIVLTVQLQHTPLQFLRHDLKRAKNKKALRLPEWKFLTRFRVRILLQNIPHYFTLALGILFIAILLAMAVGMPATLHYYMDGLDGLVFADYQYVLKDYEDEDGNPVTTENADAEKFDLYSLRQKGDELNEEISVYGIEPDSSYIFISDIKNLSVDEVYISASYSEKYDIAAGDEITLDEKYESKQYVFTVAGVVDEGIGISVFTSMENFEEIFDREEGEFSGFMSDTEITDIDENLIAAVITTNDYTKMARQLDHSMGAMMEYFQYLCIVISAILIYLLTKIIVEKNEVPISLTKILGYSSREISGLYLHATTIAVVVITAVSTWLGCEIMAVLWKSIMQSYSGWFAFIMKPMDYVRIFALIFAGYILVLVLDYRRIKKIPMDRALKDANL